MASTEHQREFMESENENKRALESPECAEPPEKRSKIETESKEYTTELDVGISEYISELQGFSGVLKQRFSDFLVNEIDSDGSIVHLTDISKPKCDEPKIKDEKPDVSLLSDVDNDRLAALLESGNNKQTYEIDVTVLDKEKRTNIHKAIKFLYPGLGSNTVDNESRKVIRVFRDKPFKKNFRANRETWPGGDSKFCHFVLYKENKDTAQAISLLSKRVYSKPSFFAWSGTKDKRAKTTQKISTHKITATRLLESVNNLNDFAVGNFSYEKNPLKLGSHSGNRFTIVLRNITGDDALIKESMTSLEHKGFINYFGLQRFGSTTVPTHAVGKEILHSKWKEAINTILKSRAGDQPDITECRKEWEKSGDPVKALAKLDRKNCIEFSLLVALKQCSTNDYVGALGRLPRNSRTMYVHSYQSYVWNMIVSKRIKKFGLKVIPGDLVIPSTLSNTDDVKINPKVITEKDVKSTNIQDVVIPLPGFDVKFPENELKNWYHEILKKDDLAMSNFKHKVKDYSCSGSYRRIIVKPSDVSWHITSYDDVTVSLTRSDLDMLKDVPKIEPKLDGKYRALVMQFSLPSAAYATMAVREIMKSDTASGFQSTLNTN